MTQAEKARAYDEAIKRAKEINNEQKAQPFDVMLKVFPELKESEDEKIKKWIIGVLSTYEHDRDLRNAAISWLEKQGKQPIYKTSSREIILAIWDLGNEWKELTKGSISTEYGTQLDYIQKYWQESEYYLRAKQSEQKSFDYESANIQNKDFAPESTPRYSIGDVLCDKSCTTLNKESQPNFEIIDIRNGMYICDKCSFPISQQDEYELVAKRIEQKPTEWHREDEQNLNACLGYIPDEFLRRWLTDIIHTKYDKFVWSEEDERKYEDIRGCIYHYCVPADAKYLCDWLETQLSK